MNAAIVSLAAGALLIATTAACGQAASNTQGGHGSVTPAPNSLQRFLPREDGWQNDPANQPHAGDANPLRRALGDSPIIHGVFGKPDLRVFTACVKQHAGVKLEGYDSGYLSKCPALQQDLLQRSHSAGFTDATVADVFDPHLLHLPGR